MNVIDAENRGRTLGAYAAYNEVLNYINTLEDRLVAKKDIFAAVMAMRPPDVPAPVRSHREEA